MPAALAAALAAGTADAAVPEGTPRQDPSAIRAAAEQFLQAQAAGLPGKVTVEIGRVDARLSLPACPSPQGFLPPGSRAWGKTTVGVRCTAPAPWTVYVAAKVHVEGEYVAAAVPLAQGQVIDAGDLALIKGDLAALPAGVITELAEATGRTAAISLPLGAALRQDALRIRKVIAQGQPVRLVSSGPGFKISAEGTALGNAAEGQIAQARTANGQVVSGVARAGGVLEVAY
ncbi:MAG: flagellar basal body P-ring formation chaperone FlgA [Burkholderiaceae bacterium]